MAHPAPRPDREEPLWEVLPLVALLAGLVLLGVPQYFRYDDAGWLRLARDAGSAPWQLLNPWQDRHAYAGLGDYFRPSVALVYWAIYRVAGADPLPYQLASGAFFTVSMVYFALAARRLAGRAGAWAAMVVSLGYAPLVAYGIYRMGLLHVGQALMLAGAYHLLRGAQEGSRRHIVLGVACGVASALARQTAAVILPAVACVWCLTEMRLELRKRVVRAGVSLACGAAVIAALLAVSHYVGGARDGGALRYALERTLFYGHALFTAPGGYLAAAAGLAGWSVAIAPRRGAARAIRALWAALPLAAPILTRHPDIALPVVVLGLLAATIRLRSRTLLLGLAWTAAGIVPYLNFHAGYPRYLQEALYGFALAAGVALVAWIDAVWPAHWRPRPRVTLGRRGGEWIVVACLAAMPVCAVLPSAALLLPPAHGAAGALRSARQTSRDMRRLVEAAVRTLPRGARLGEPIVDLAALRDPTAREAASAETRAVTLPPMEPSDLQELFAVLGRADVTVVAWSPAAGPRVDALLCLTAAQRDAALAAGWMPRAHDGGGAGGTALLVPREDPARR